MCLLAAHIEHTLNTIIIIYNYDDDEKSATRVVPRYADQKTKFTY